MNSSPNCRLPFGDGEAAAAGHSAAWHLAAWHLAAGCAIKGRNVKKWIIVHKVISFCPKGLKNRNRKAANAPKEAKSPQNGLLVRTRRAGATRQAAEPYKKRKGLSH